MKFVVSALVLVLSLSSYAAQQAQQFPEGPDARLTPGALCTHPTEYRYPERIPYCARKVDGDVKKSVFTDYDTQLGYSTRSMDRQEFKVDHYIPLCMGGSNEVSNLWPQHVSVYTLTDPMEPLACEKMAEGKLTQVHAVELIKKGKNDHTQIDAVMAELNSL